MTAPHIDIGSFWLPKASSTVAPSVDTAWDVVMWVCVVFFVVLMGAMTYFVIVYRRKREGEVTSAIDHNTQLEIGWTVVPLVILIALFFVGLSGYVSASVAPAESYEIQVTAEKWLWKFTYPNGIQSGNKLVVPKGKPVRLVMSAKDVIHSFYVPEFRVKQDVVPGLYTSLWFEATEAKEVALLCTEYCGAGHSDMNATVVVLEPAKFQEWLDSGGEDKNTPPAEYGKQLFASWGCTTCHSLDGAKGQGPTLKGIFGRDEMLADGTIQKVDENYLRESILMPTAKQVKGYPLIMPTFQGQLKDRQVDSLIAYLKEQK